MSNQDWKADYKIGHNDDEDEREVKKEREDRFWID